MKYSLAFLFVAATFIMVDSFPTAAPRPVLLQIGRENCEAICEKMEITESQFRSMFGMIFIRGGFTDDQIRAINAAAGADAILSIMDERLRHLAEKILNDLGFPKLGRQTAGFLYPILAEVLLSAPSTRTVSYDD